MSFHVYKSPSPSVVSIQKGHSKHNTTTYRSVNYPENEWDHRITLTVLVRCQKPYARPQEKCEKFKINRGIRSSESGVSGLDGRSSRCALRCF